MDSSRLSRLSAEEKRALLARLLRRRARGANDTPLSHGQRALWFLHRLGPYRATLFRRADDDHYLLVTVHHIVSDYWTLGVLMDELNAIYRAVRAGAPVPLPPPERSYADFVTWQQDLLAGPEGDRLWEYWRE